MADAGSVWSFVAVCAWLWMSVVVCNCLKLQSPTDRWVYVTHYITTFPNWFTPTYSTVQTRRSKAYTWDTAFHTLNCCWTKVMCRMHGSLKKGVYLKSYALSCDTTSALENQSITTDTWFLRRQGDRHDRQLRSQYRQALNQVRDPAYKALHRICSPSWYQKHGGTVSSPFSAVSCELASIFSWSSWDLSQIKKTKNEQNKTMPRARSSARNRCRHMKKTHSRVTSKLYTACAAQTCLVFRCLQILYANAPFAPKTSDDE